jgi:ribose transport system ATP-binding protein
MVQEQSGESKVPLLELVGISKNYGGVKALIESNFKCGSGEVHAVLGENGAGKSTLLKILCGVVKKDTGVIRLRGEQIEINSPNDAEKHGIAAVFQELSLVQDLSVAENIYI